MTTTRLATSTSRSLGRRRAAVMAALLVPVLVPMPAAVLAQTAAPAGQGAAFTREPNTDRSGNDIRGQQLAANATADDCERLCAAMRDCRSFTFVKRSTTVPVPVCRLKDAAPHGHESSCCTSGMRQP